MGDDTQVRDTATIAAENLQALTEAQEGPSEPAPSETPAPAETHEAPPSHGTNGKAVSEAEQLLRDEGYLTERKPDGRWPYIPRWKVVSMIESGLKKRAAAIEEERKKWDGERKTLSADAEAARQFRKLLDGDPRAMIAEIAKYDPRYASLLQEQARERPKVEDDPEPQPDVHLGGGRYTYSLEGLQKRDAWRDRQLERRFEDKLKPYADREKALKEREERDAVERRISERGQAQIARAKTWPKWQDHEAAILKALQDDSAESERTGQPMKYGSIHDAYIDIVMPHLTGDHNKVRESVMRELNQAPRSTSVGTTGNEPVRAPSQRTTEEIARRALARLEGKG